MPLAFELTQAEKNQYALDGFLLRESVFSEQEIKALGLAAERAEKQALALSQEGKTYFLDGKRFVDHQHITIQFEPGQTTQSIKVIEPVHELDPLLDQLIDDPRIVQPMCNLLESKEISLWTNKLNLKRAKEGTGFGWHQDSPYWIHDSDHVDLLPNVMLSFDEASRDNGCLQVIRGSHTEGCLPGKIDGSQLGGFYTDPERFDEANAVLMEVPPGSLIFFNPHSVHGSSANTSNQARRAMVLTYQPAGFPTLKRREIRPVSKH